MLVNREVFKAAGITATVVFESSAVNRDEKIAESIQSIRKLGRRDGTYSFMSRAFIRHHMFVALGDLCGWQPAPVTKDGEVLQFDFPDANIVTYPELDLFGFMRTNPVTVTRKAPLGVTKAISLEPWQGDMAFYANHDMVARALKRSLKEGREEDINPNPFTKEEHYSLYKITFTLDLFRFGQQEIIINFKKSGGEKQNEEEKEEKDSKRKKKGESKAGIQALENWLKGLAKVSVDEVRKNVKRLLFEEEDDVKDWHAVARAGNINRGKVAGYVGVKSLEEKGYWLHFLVTDDEYRERLKQVLTVIAGGFSLHSSTERYGTNPLFCAMAALKIPVPVFHSAIAFEDGGISAGLLARVRKNSHIIKAWYESLRPLAGELKEEESDFIRGIDVDAIAEFVCPLGKDNSVNQGESS